MRFVVGILLIGAGAVAAPPVRFSGFDANPAGWRVWSPRAEIAPRAFVDHVNGRSSRGALALSGNSNPAAFGGWETTIEGIQGGNWYALSAWWRSAGATFEVGQVLARLDWVDGTGKRAGQPDYAWMTRPEGSWNHVTLSAPAPAKASAVKLQLFLANAPQATVWWDDIAFEPAQAPKPRPVTVATLNFRPQRPGSAAESVRQFIAGIGKAVPGRTDMILLPEGITVVGTGKTDADVAETIPGPTTAALGEVARERKTYIVAGIYEREGATIYNTAVLIDRAGNVAGKYRKVYLPREEYEAGLTPGVDYPVFDTDFGRVGIMICWDVYYPDPARALALRGAEIILMPIWDGPYVMSKTRALENHVFLVASSYGHPNSILDPTGEEVAVAPERGTAAVATIDLSRRYADAWLGDMRGRMRKEMRLDVSVLPGRPALGGQQDQISPTRK